MPHSDARSRYPLRDRQRILVVGPGGAGKSTFARTLGALVGLPVIHLDRHYWRAGWQPTPPAEWNEVVAGLAAQDAWIMDGNYSGSLALRLPRCDAIVLLDFPRAVCLWRVLKRRLTVRHTARPDMADACPERLPLEFILWIWRYRKRSRARVIDAIASSGRDVEVLSLTKQSDVDCLLGRVQGNGDSGR
jgi:adenylate kinase family enzyme